MLNSGSKVTVLVYGGGGLGLYFAARLAQAGYRVILKARAAAATRSRKEPLRVKVGESVDAVDGIMIVSDLSSVSADAAIVTTKAWQVASAVQEMRDALKPGAPVLTVQNGIDAPRVAAEQLDADQVFASSTVVIAQRTDLLDVTVIGSEAALVVGNLVGTQESTAGTLLSALRSADINVAWSNEIARVLWRKLALICSYGGIGAVLDATVGETRKDARTRGLVESAMREVFAVAGSEGVQLDDEDLSANLQIYLNEFSASTTSSMHRDVLAGRPSELEDQVGAVVHRSQKSGVPTPVLDLVYAALSKQAAQASSAVNVHS